MNVGLVRFAEPLALIALVLVPLLAALVWFEARRRRQADARYGGSSALRLGTSPARRAAQGAMLVAAAALLIIAAARPQWGHQETEAEQRGIDIAVVLDVSRSMTATDIAPSRARAAAAGLRDMLGHLDGNRVALVTFAGTAFTRSPLTVDLPALANLVDRAQNDSPLVQAGTDLRVAIESAVLLLSVTDRAQTQVIVLISDGEDLGADVQSAIERANAQGIAIHTVFAATETPTALPAASGGTDQTRGDPRNLTAIARGTGGTTRDVRGMAGLAVDFRRLQQTQFQTAQTRAPRDHFSWFIGGALVLLLAQAALPTSTESRLLPRVRLPQSLRSRRARRGAAGIAMSAIIVMLTGCTTVLGTDAYRRVEAGNGLYNAGQFDRALQEYTVAAGLEPNDLAIQYNLANALYRLGRYEETLRTVDAALAKHPEATLSTRLLYTAGNAAMQREDYERARAAYRQALRQDAEDMDAKANLELVLRRIAPPPTPTPTPPPGQDGQGQQGQQGQGQQPGQPGQPGQQGQPGQPGEQGQPGQQPGQPGGGGGGQAQPGGAGQPGGQGAGSNPSTPGSPSATDPDGSRAALNAANAALEAALAQLGPEVSPEEAANILALAQRANDLGGLAPRNPRGGVPAR